MDLKEVKTQLDRMEAKQDAYLERLVVVETNQTWLKGHLKYLWVLVLGAVGKLAHTTFIK